MVFEIRGKSAIVTGGTEGIGLALVERFLQEGVKVLIANRNEKLAAELLPELKKKYNVGDDALLFAKMDLVDMPSIYAAFDAAVAAFGTVDIVIANAGFQIAKDFFKDDDKYWIDQIMGNLGGTMALGKAAANHWLEKGTEGVFVANSSFAGLHGLFRTFQSPAWIAYGSAKGGIISFIDFMQGNMEMAAASKGLDRSPIRFSCVCPSFVWTSIFIKAGLGANPEEASEHPLYKDVLPPYGYWTPMDKTVDAFMRLVTGEDERGTCLVLCGEGGEARDYQNDVDAEAYISRGARPGNYKEGITKLIDGVRDAARASQN